MLADQGSECVFCEWHDDFVLEFGRTAGVFYAFHQVKTKSTSTGPWGLGEVFGVARAGNAKPSVPSKKKPAKPKAVIPLNGDAIVPKMIEHYLSFGDACESVVLVTNNGIQPAFAQFLLEIKAASTVADLPPVTGAVFEALWTSYATAFAQLTRHVFFDFVKRFGISSDAGSPMQDAIYHEVADMILELSETDLTTTQARNIGKELVNLVRDRSHRLIDLGELPLATDDLRSRKGVSPGDVLKLLSLSAEGFAELRKGTGTKVVRSLSRLHEVCRRNAVPDALIPHLCRMKTEWDVWWRGRRHDFQEGDIASLKNDCIRALSSQNEPNKTFDYLAAQASEIAKKYENALPRGAELNRDLVLGLIMAIIAEQEIRR